MQRPACSSTLVIFAILFALHALQVAPAATGEPDGTAEKAAKEKEDARRAAAFDAWVATLPPDQQKWEHVLAENLGSFYLPIYQMQKVDRHEETAWDYVKDDPSLPRVLLIGDSISRGYTVPTRHALDGKVNLHRAPANCGPTSYGLDHLDAWLGDGHWNLIHFNFGIHDVNRKTSRADYLANLNKLIDRLQATGAKLVWATSTPLNTDDAHRQGIIDFNAAAAELMKKRGVAIDDLYTAILPHVDEWQNPKDHCHYGAPGYEFLGSVVSQNILENLKSSEKLQ
ncbi:MAG: SGNH/GDSL hydrolase family protein [Planctomycetes bacterium]|nr:SGNH/GDSL hydrolase family protein [Planctomycetota bacterium]